MERYTRTDLFSNMELFRSQAGVLIPFELIDPNLKLEHCHMVNNSDIDSFKSASLIVSERYYFSVNPDKIYTSF